MIIGVTGSYAAGKDTVGEYLKSKGFVARSLSDIIREEVRKEGKEETRQNLIDKGNEIRSKFGPGELAKRTIHKILGSGEEKTVVTSIRNPKEVEEFRKSANFILWFVDAPARLRYNRLVKRSRTGDIGSFEEFVEKERIENSDNPNNQQLGKVAEIADAILQNDYDLENLYKQIDALIK